MPSSTVFSFDVFDTAVCRLIHSPEHIHLSVARKLRAIGLSSLSDGEWLFARIDAEYRERQSVWHREISLDVIYERLGRELDFDADGVQVAMRVEFLEESRLIRPVSVIRARVRSLMNDGERVLFLSDTYFSRAQVEALLDACEYGKSLDVVVSSEQSKSKLAGTLFDHVAAQRGLLSSTFRHVGDNGLADIEMANARGWRSELFSESHHTSRERVLFASGDGGFLASAIAGCARAARLGQEVPVNRGVETAASSVVGPLFAAYVLWILGDVVARGGRTIYFLARDGQVLVPMCQRLAAWLGVDIEARYLFASRQAFLLSALSAGQDGAELIENSLGLAYYDGIPLVDALRSLKFSDAEISQIETRIGVDAGKARGDFPVSAMRILAEMLERPRFLDPLRSRIREAQAATLRYLESEGMFEGEKAIVVDLGWRGTTQLRLQKTVGDRVEVIGYYLGLTNTVLGPEAQRRVWTSSVPIKTGLLEVMASADHTSVSGFGLTKEGTGAPFPPVMDDDALIRWGARQQQEIAVRFVDYLTQAVERDQYGQGDLYTALRAAALASYRHFRLSPSRAEAEAYGGLAHSDDVNHQRSRELAGRVSSIDLVRHALRLSSRSEVSNWYAGSLARSHEYLLPRLVSTSLDRSIVTIARLRTRRRRLASLRSAQASLEARSPL